MILRQEKFKNKSGWPNGKWSNEHDLHYSKDYKDIEYVKNEVNNLVEQLIGR